MPIYLLSPVKKVDTIHLPMIHFTLLDVELSFTHHDMLMFTSKQAVISVETLNPKWKDIPCLSIGKATSEQIIKLGGRVIYEARSFYAASLANETITFLQDKNILYLRPKMVSFDMKSFFNKAGLTLEEQIIYETSCVRYERKNKPLQNAIIIFTSPSSIQCFFKNFAWDETYTAVLIGDATRKHLPQNIPYEVADMPLIASCIEKAKEILTANKL